MALDPSIPLRVWTAVGSLIAELHNTLADKRPDSILREINGLLKNPTIWENSGAGFPEELAHERYMAELDRVFREKLTEIRLSDDGERAVRKANVLAFLDRMGKEIAAMGKA